MIKNFFCVFSLVFSLNIITSESNHGLLEKSESNRVLFERTNLCLEETKEREALRDMHAIEVAQAVDDFCPEKKVAHHSPLISQKDYSFLVAKTKEEKK